MPGPTTICIPDRGFHGGCCPLTSGSSSHSPGQGERHSQDLGLLKYLQHHLAPSDTSGMSGVMDHQQPYRQITVWQAEGHQVWYHGQQHKSFPEHCAGPFLFILYRLLLQLWVVSHPEVCWWQGWSGGGVREHRRTSAVQHSQGERTGHRLWEFQASVPSPDLMGAHCHWAATRTLGWY